MKKLLSLLLLAILSSTSMAFTVATRNGDLFKKADKHFLYVVGYSDKLGTMMVKSAVTMAEKYKELYPNSFHLFIIAKDPQYTTERLSRFPFTINYNSEEDLTAKAFIDIVSKHDEDFSAVHVFSHTQASAGVGLQSSHRLSYTDPLLKKLGKSLEKNAYIFLHGCNSGWYQAPGWSKLLKVPVWGSFAGTDFEEIYNNGASTSWFTHNEGQYPDGASLAETNIMSFSQNMSCYLGHCARMRPDNSGYNGYWGKYEVGLGFYKQFCQGANSKNCASAFKKVLFTHPSNARLTRASNYGAYRAILTDFLCPSKSNGTKRRECESLLAQTEQNPQGIEFMDSFKGQPVICNSNNSCKFNVSCNNEGKCSVTAPQENNQGLSELQKEYLQGLRAWGSSLD